MDFYGPFLYFAYAIFQNDDGSEEVDTDKLKSIKMIWLGVKKTNGKWLCKDPAENLNGYEGIVSRCPEVYEPFGLKWPVKNVITLFLKLQQVLCNKDQL